MTAAAAGYVLAGGQSRRMGRDKALLPWGGTTLLGHALQRVREVCETVAILCGDQPRYTGQGVPVVTDAVAGAGPLAALLAALEHSHHDAVLLLAVDLPFAPPALMAHLLDSLPGADVVVPLAPDGPQPLCAAYTRSCREAVRRRLNAGERRMTSFWPDVTVRQLAPAEVGAWGDAEVLLRNLNTPNDYEAFWPPPR